MIKINHTTEISYFKGILFVTLEENYPEKVIDAQFIEERTELAEQHYEADIREGKTPIEEGERANDVLLRGLGVSKIAMVRLSHFCEFADSPVWHNDVAVCL